MANETSRSQSDRHAMRLAERLHKLASERTLPADQRVLLRAITDHDPIAEDLLAGRPSATLEALLATLRRRGERRPVLYLVTEA